MSNELYEHKRSDTVKWILTLLAFILVGVMLAGIILGWFEREEETPADPAGETDLAGQTTDTGTAEPAAENQADEQAADAPAEGQTDEE